MLRFLFALWGLTIITSPLKSQEVNTDSLRNRLNAAKASEKVELLLELSRSFPSQNSDSAILYADRALKLSTEQNDKLLIADSYAALGKIYLENLRVDESMDNLIKAGDLYKELNEKEKLTSMNLNLGQNLYNLRKYEEAFGYYEKARIIAEEINNEDLIASALFYSARVFNRMNRGEDALEAYLSALEKWQELEKETELAMLYNDLGSYYSVHSDFLNAVKYYEKTLEIRRSQNNNRGIGIVLNNLGNQHLQLGNFDKAIEYYREASGIFREINFDLGTAATLTGMAVIYENLRQYKSVLDVYSEVLEIRKKSGDQYELANTLSNIAVTYSKMLNDSLENLYGVYYQDTIYEKGIKPAIEFGYQSIDNNLQALAIRREINHTRGISITLANLGHVYQSMGEFEKANQYFSEWLRLPAELQDEDTKIPIYIGLGKLAMYEGEFNKAILYFNDAYRSALAINKKLHIREAARNLSDLYEKTGNYKEALSYFQQFHNIYDSLNQENTRKQIHEMQVQYETEAKEKENELLRKDQLINETKLKNSRKALVAAILILGIFTILVIQLIRQNNFRRKANEELALKNELITGQAKEITDSIQYASRIQNAVLPPVEYVNKLLPENFILFRPRDIVSGDYYWITERNNKKIVMVADCTGHGVPGAFMSMLGVAYLNEIVSKYREISTDQILNDLRRHVIHSLHQTGKEGESQDGMDVSLYILDNDTLKLQFSGANNSLLIFRDEEMIELKADKMPIGIHTNISAPFSREEYQLKKGDMIYSFSDGFPDQFGGPLGKKFMIRNFKKLLSQIYTLSITEQREVLEKNIVEWMADYDQIDDILVMGVRV